MRNLLGKLVNSRKKKVVSVLAAVVAISCLITTVCLGCGLNSKDMIKSVKLDTNTVRAVRSNEDLQCNNENNNCRENISRNILGGVTEENQQSVCNNQSQKCPVSSVINGDITTDCANGSCITENNTDNNCTTEECTTAGNKNNADKNNTVDSKNQQTEILVDDKNTENNTANEEADRNTKETGCKDVDINYSTKNTDCNVIDDYNTEKSENDHLVNDIYNNQCEGNETVCENDNCLDNNCENDNCLDNNCQNTNCQDKNCLNNTDDNQAACNGNQGCLNNRSCNVKVITGGNFNCSNGYSIEEYLKNFINNQSFSSWSNTNSSKDNNANNSTSGNANNNTNNSTAGNANNNTNNNTADNSNNNSGINTSGNNVNSSNSQSSEYIDEVIRLVNVERNKAGLPSLTKNAQACTVANVRANEIVTSFSHTRPNGKDCFSVLSEYNISYRASGENIAMGQKTPAEVMEAWMNSSGHRANILSGNFSEIGVGVVYSQGRYYWAQMFLG